MKANINVSSRGIKYEIQADYDEQGQINLLKKVAANNTRRAKNKATGAGRNDNSYDKVKNSSFDSTGLATH